MTSTKLLGTGKETGKFEVLGRDFGARFAIGRFDAQGRGFEAALRLKNEALTADLGFCMSIGGCEAMRDIQDAKLLGADFIHAPLIESDFALRKFGQALDKVFADEEQPAIGFSIESSVGARHVADMFEQDALCSDVIERAGFVLFDFAYFDPAIAQVAKSRDLDVILSGDIPGSAAETVSKLLADTLIDGIAVRDLCFYPTQRSASRIAVLFAMGSLGPDERSGPESETWVEALR